MVECVVCFDIVTPEMRYTYCAYCDMKCHTSCHKKWVKRCGEYDKMCTVCQQNNCLFEENNSTFWDYLCPCFNINNYVKVMQ